ncbi:MAG TPA: hypothetical protein DGG94_11845 [Micromonosporaceae bacterium]|nr:hypothetical protein [Micromonosporaceae bacterium]
MGLPVLFFAPHQDDETLLMGVEIVRHVSAGRQAIVICAGDGSKSGALPASTGRRRAAGTASNMSPLPKAGRRSPAGRWANIARPSSGRPARPLGRPNSCRETCPRTG